MTLSHRITNVTGGGSDGWGLFYKARKMIANGVPIIELTIGEHDIRTHPVILDAIDKSAKGGHTGYASVPGTKALRETVAKRIESRTGVATTPENILITPGGQAGLFAAHHATCDEGDTALFVDPFYATYPGTIRGLGAVPKPVIARAKNQFQIAEADLEAAATGAKSLLINTPNNPTGAVYTRETLEGIARVCAHHDLWLISDEVYDSQIWSGIHISPRALPGMAERTLVVGSMSKSHAMTGSRVGWICGPKDAIAHLENLATHTTYGVPGYIQDAAEFAINEGAWLEDEVAAPFVRRRQITLDVMSAQNLIKVSPISGAMYAMLDIRATGLTGEEFANRLLETHHIAVMPGESFGQAAAGHLRVAMTVADDVYEASLKTICDFAQAQV